jgi:tetratricopeptide (TPR) repeat protein
MTYSEAMSFRRLANRIGIKWKKLIKKALAGLMILCFLALIPAIYYGLLSRSSVERRQLRSFFESGAFDAAYSQSKVMLKEKPLDIFLLTIHGFSAYQLAIAQINSFDTLSYIDECIWSLRKALLLRDTPSEGRIFYVLGKAYFYKGLGYADLSVKYLEKARTASFMATDIPEYLGLAYAAIRDFRGSVAAFTLALTREPSDLLLLSIARSYIALGEEEAAKAYLIRCQGISRDSRTITASRLLLGSVLAKMGDSSGAETEFLTVIEENGEHAEAYFQLGELYAMNGDTARARAEWRRAVRTDPTHAIARSRLN